MKKTDNKLNGNVSKLYLIPIIIFIAIVPLITRGKLVALEDLRYNFWLGQENYLDIFTYWKSIFIMISGTLAFLMYIFMIKGDDIKTKLEKKYSIPLFIITVAIIFSSILAIDKTTALLGFPDMTQGLFVLLSYIVMVVYSASVINEEEQVKFIFKTFAILVIIEGVLGVGQYFGHDFLRSELAEKILIPSNLVLEDGLKFTFGPKAIYATLFNTNFVGSFGVLAIPIMFVMITSSKKMLNKIFYTIAFAFSVFIWFGSNSRAGYVGLIVGVIFAIILMRKYILKKWRISLLFVCFVIIGMGMFNRVSDGKLIKEISTLNIFSSEVKDSFTYKDNFYLKELTADGQNLNIVTNKEKLLIKYNDGQLLVYDDKGNNLMLFNNKNGFYTIMKDDKKTSFSIMPMKIFPGYRLKTIENSIITFHVSDKVRYIDQLGNISNLQDYPYISFFNERGKMASGRGYIWSRSIPLIKDYLFYGAGPDNYPYAFPQGDVVGKVNFFRSNNNMIVDKPHNMYIQMAINTGLISLLAFLALILIYMTSVIKSMWKSNFDYAMDKVNVAILISIVGYLAAGMFNDQINSVAPIFYVLLGLGIAVNRLCLVEQRRQKYMKDKDLTK